MSTFRLPRRRPGFLPDDTASDELVVDDLGPGDEDELREFMAADVDPPQADPLFRERLRRRLWAMLREQRRRV
jgi:hypothetical protein